MSTVINTSQRYSFILFILLALFIYYTNILSVAALSPSLVPAFSTPWLRRNRGVPPRSCTAFAKSGETAQYQTADSTALFSGIRQAPKIGSHLLLISTIQESLLFQGVQSA